MDVRIARLRIAACFLVVLLHVSSKQALQFGSGWWIANILESFSRICVPIFLMISGALLLKKAEPLGVFLRKRFSRVFPPLIFWSCFYLAWLTYNGVSTESWIKAIFSGPTMYHLWYLYAIIGLYALVPVLRRFYQASNLHERLWVLALWIVVGSVWPTTSVILSPHSCPAIGPTSSAAIYHLSEFGSYAGFFILGAMLSELRVSAKLSLFVFASCSIATMTLMYWHSMQVGRPCETFYGYLSPFVIAASSGFFCLFLSADKVAPSKFVTCVADCTFGAYCLHIIVIGGIFPRIGMSITLGSDWFYIPIITISAFVLSIMVVYLLRITSLGRLVT